MDRRWLAGWEDRIVPLDDEPHTERPDVVYPGQVSEHDIAAQRTMIEVSGDVCIVGEPEIRRVPNDGYIIGPDAPSECHQVVFRVEMVSAPGTSES